ncbi:hypothetical protein NQZ68_031497 [Dissostichus eleginoides]|nr:hypothetical protein NQZ68_031497 [Dissostichus eleginoides]
MVYRDKDVPYKFVVHLVNESRGSSGVSVSAFGQPIRMDSRLKRQAEDTDKCDRLAVARSLDVSYRVIGHRSKTSQEGSTRGTPGAVG